MKPKFILIIIALLTIVIGAKADVEINSKNFPDENFRSFLLAQDYGRDSVLTDEEIKWVDLLWVNNKGIKSLKGIEIFKQLKGLYCYDNELTDLDISWNTELTWLNCSNNRLTELNVKWNTKLTAISCSNNRLTALDVTWNTELTNLLCGQNKLTALDLSKNTELTYLYCYLNQIKGDKMDALIASLPKHFKYNRGYFNVNYNTQDEGNVITPAQVKAADERNWQPSWYNGASWVNYGGSVRINKQNFPDDAFRNYLFAQDYGKDSLITDEEHMKLKTIDVGGLGVKSLKGLDLLQGLNALWCHDNQLDDLDVSHNPALAVLNCDNNRLTELDLSWNRALVGLSCTGNHLSALDVSNNKELTELFCNNNGLTALSLSQNKALTYLDCSNNKLTELDLSNNRALVSLYCSKNALISLDVSHNPALNVIYCAGNQLNTLDLSKNTALEYLDCYDNQLTALDLSKNTALIQLYCYHNQIKDDKMDALIASLPMNTTYIYNYFLVIGNSEAEGNVITTSQVMAAYGHGWVSCHLVGNIWMPFDVQLKKGDVNGDDAVDVADIGTVIDVMAGKTPGLYKFADVNGDKTVDVADIAIIIDIMAGKYEDPSGTDHAPKGAVAVDLGLPSGVKWANMNVGAEKPEDYGLFFAWGETTGYTSVPGGSQDSNGAYSMYDHSFEWKWYKWCNGYFDTQTKYCNNSEYGTVDNLTTLLPEDDAARANWGGLWQMPTYDDMVELFNKTHNVWTTENGVYGRRFTSVINGNSIFLPAAGARYEGKLRRQSECGFYWSSSLDPEYSGAAHCLDFLSEYAQMDALARYYGLSVRPVLKK